jgi:hypothetical protein
MVCASVCESVGVNEGGGGRSGVDHPVVGTVLQWAASTLCTDRSRAKEADQIEHALSERDIGPSTPARRDSGDAHVQSHTTTENKNKHNFKTQRNLLTYRTGNSSKQHARWHLPPRVAGTCDATRGSERVLANTGSVLVQQLISCHLVNRPAWGWHCHAWASLLQ